MSILISDALEIVSEEMLKVLKKRWKHFLLSLTKATNRVEMSLTQTPGETETAVLKKISNSQYLNYKVRK